MYMYMYNQLKIYFKETKENEQNLDTTDLQ